MLLAGSHVVWNDHDYEMYEVWIGDEAVQNGWECDGVLLEARHLLGRQYQKGEGV